MKFYESEYEEALITLLREVGWDYTHGSTLHRTNREMLLTDDLRSFLEEQHPELESEDVTTSSTTSATRVGRRTLPSYVRPIASSRRAIAIRGRAMGRLSTSLT